jgi:predicted tellurium resistance membrane protein TerC
MARIRRFVQTHPFLVAWALLAVGMVAILLWTSNDAHLLPNQLAFLVFTTILLAGACVWIISWEEPLTGDQ